MEQVYVIGAGPAGMGTAYELTKGNTAHSFDLHILDKDSVVGGLAQTSEFHGYKFDIGPHRYYTKNKEVLALWQSILGKDLLTIPRLTRILYRHRFFRYPIHIPDVIVNLGLPEAIRCFLSYCRARIFLRKLQPKTFEQWITKHFGSKLYHIFFKTYTEKVWGISCSQIGAEWAAQRIKNLNFVAVAKNALLKKKGDTEAKSLISTFWYPRFGSGSFFTRLQLQCEKKGAQFYFNQTVGTLYHENNLITHLEVNGKKYPVDSVFSSMPLPQLIQSLDPLPPESILKAAAQLSFRDHITVNIIVDNPRVVPDNWMYIHAPEVQMARIANYTNFSSCMIGKKGTSGLSVEYFVFQKDPLWNSTDAEIIALAKKELVQLHLCTDDELKEAFVTKERDAYPMYYLGHKKYFEIIQSYVSQFTNLALIGRGGMFRYNNMDHSLYSGMLAARNYLAGKQVYNIWNINEDAEYHE
ncbi:NAD(P)-binding protein [Candidatus Roizmanbacteria bacterium]|nr:NAD(P)-binding protein [Candidatus Roizmanbacteria bacterium]